MPLRSLPSRSPRRLVALLAVAGALACGGDSPTQPSSGTDENPDIVKLTISVGTGVLGVPTSTGPYAKGTTISYAYNTQPGYTNLRVTLDGASIPGQGTIKMDAPHTLVATATASAAAVVATR